MTQNGYYLAEVIRRIKSANNQPVVVILTEIETGLEEVHTYTNDLKHLSDRKPSGFDLVVVLPNKTFPAKPATDFAKENSDLLKEICNPSYVLTEAGEKFVCSDDVCSRAGVGA